MGVWCSTQGQTAQRGRVGVGETGDVIRRSRLVCGQQDDTD